MANKPLLRFAAYEADESTPWFSGSVDSPRLVQIVLPTLGDVLVANRAQVVRDAHDKVVAIFDRSVCPLDGNGAVEAVPALRFLNEGTYRGNRCNFIVAWGEQSEVDALEALLRTFEPARDIDLPFLVDLRGRTA